MEIDAALAAGLVAAQFPRWAALPGANPLGAEQSARIVADLVAEHRAL